MTPCVKCGRIETPLVDGPCPSCRSAGSQASRSRGADLTNVTVEPSPIAPPSRFLAWGLFAEIAGGVSFAIASDAYRHRSSSPASFFAILAAVLLSAGGILILVGVIRWAIWPLIERRDDK
jgi:hypothetical protein